MGQTQRMIDWLLVTAQNLDDEPRLGKEADCPELKGDIVLSDKEARNLSAGLREAAASFTPEGE